MEKLTDKDRLVKLISSVYLVSDSSSFVESLSLEEYAVKLLNKAANYVIVEEGEDAGLISFYNNDKVTKTGYIALIGVLADYQGRGMAQKLMDHCVSECHSTGMEQIKLEVKKDNRRAIRFYEHYDFQKIEEASDKSIYMCKKLDT
jgi:ribosomal protein S18 acetylase RimI-like enzyme